MNHARGIAAPTDAVAFLYEIFDARGFWRAHPQELRLHVQMPVQLQIRLVDQHGGFRRGMQQREASHVINVRVCAHNRPHVQLLLAQNLQDALDFVAGIHDDRITRLRIAQDRAIALQHPYRNNFVNQFFAHPESIATPTVTGQFPVGALIEHKAFRWRKRLISPIEE